MDWLFSDSFLTAPPNRRKEFFSMSLCLDYIAYLDDAQLAALYEAVAYEVGAREKEASRIGKSEAAKASKRQTVCPKCGLPPTRKGKADGVQLLYCRRCGLAFSESTATALHMSKLPLGKIRLIVTLIMLDCPDWAIKRIAGVNVKTAQYWRDRCLDAATEWSMRSKLSGHVWMDEMRFAPNRSEGLVGGVWVTYAGKIAKDYYMEVAVDGSGQGFCHVYYEKSGTPTREMILSAVGDRIEGDEGTVLTHDGAPSHNLLVRSLGVRDDWHKFIAGDPDYEKAMATMSNCCSYLRHSFESHQGIKFGKLEAYGNFFLYRWSHMKKGGLDHSIDCMMTRLCSTPKSHLFDDYGKKGEIWSR